MTTARVVHIASRLNVGGLAVMVLNTAKGLNDEGWECHVAAGHVDANEGDMLDFLGKPERLHVIPGLGRKVRPMDDIRALREIYLLLVRLRPDIVHTHASKAGILGRIAARLAKVPVVVHSYHGHVFEHYFSRPVSFGIVTLERALGWMTDAVCLPSETVATHITYVFGIVPKRKAHVVRYGIDVEHFAATPWKKEAARRELGIRPDVLLVGSVGRLAPIKDHVLLIKSFCRLPEEIGGKRVEIFIHGEGESRGTIEEAVSKSHARERVHFAGFVKDIRCVYAALDVLAISSKSEGMATSAIEAMASCVSVVSTDVGGMRDLLAWNQRGIISPRETFPEGISMALAQTHKKKLAARDYVLKNHNIGSMVSDTTYLYRGLLERRFMDSLRG